jgi:hypothetical protein
MAPAAGRVGAAAHCAAAAGAGNSKVTRQSVKTRPPPRAERQLFDQLSAQGFVGSLTRFNAAAEERPLIGECQPRQVVHSHQIKFVSVMTFATSRTRGALSMECANVESDSPSVRHRLSIGANQALPGSAACPGAYAPLRNISRRNAELVHL